VEKGKINLNASYFFHLFLNEKEKNHHNSQSFNILQMFLTATSISKVEYKKNYQAGQYY
jgi:hypothetical protein